MDMTSRHLDAAFDFRVGSAGFLNISDKYQLGVQRLGNRLGSDHPFRDSASYVTETAGTNRPSHSPVTRFTAKCDFGLNENFE